MSIETSLIGRRVRSQRPIPNPDYNRALGASYRNPTRILSNFDGEIVGTAVVGDSVQLLVLAFDDHKIYLCGLSTTVVVPVGADESYR